MVDELLKEICKLHKRHYYWTQEPVEWHYEEVDDYCNECGCNLGKVKKKIVTKWKNVKKLWNPEKYEAFMKSTHLSNYERVQRFGGADRK